MTFKFTHRLVATAVLAALTLPALAQPAPSASAPAPTVTSAPATTEAARPAPERRAHAERHAEHRKHNAQHHAQRVAAFKAKLQLTPAQESAWNTYTQALEPGQRTARLERHGMEQLTTPERIDRMRAMRAQHAAEADRRGEATKAFYATLTPEQQKTFDVQTRHFGKDAMKRHAGHKDVHKKGHKPGHPDGHHGKKQGPGHGAQHNSAPQGTQPPAAGNAS